MYKISPQENHKYGEDGKIAVYDRLGIELLPTYDFPGDLFYTYLKGHSTYISQTPADHYKANGIFATDVATGGRPLEMYAPDLNNKEVEYIVSYEENWKEHYGKALVLTSGMERFIIGHIDGVVAVSDTIKTGDHIGKTNMEGFTTGYHAHIEYWTGVEKEGGVSWKQSEYKVDPNYNPHQALIDKKEEKKTTNQERIDDSIVHFTTYNHACNQTKGGIKGEGNNCYATPQAPCAVGKYKGNTSGFCGDPRVGGSGANVLQLYKDGKNPIALSSELRDKFGYGGTVLVTPVNDINKWIQPFEAVVVDALNGRYNGHYRGDLFKDDKSKNTSFNATITKVNK